MIKFEFFFDCSSPWTYLAFSRIHSVIEKYNIEPIWKPILVGGVFNEVNKDIYAQRENPNPRKFKYSRKDMQDWAELANIKIMWPSIFPVNAVKMMRIAIVAEEENKLRKNTENLIERGGFGSPTIFINDSDMYFGNDRIELVDYKLSKLKKNS